MANAAPAIPIDASGTDSPATPDQPIIERISSLDFIRGIAIVGILWANILGYSRPGIAYRWQSAFYELDWADNAIWLFQYVLIDGKLRGLFALLFGAGIVLFLERARTKGVNARWLQFRRLFWLALFGLAHYLLLYRGDILFHYSVLAMVAMWAVFWKPKWLLVIGALLYCADSVGGTIDLGGWVQWENQALAAPESSQIRAEYLAEAEDMRAAGRAESALFANGSFGQIVAHRTSNVADFLSATLFMAMDSLPLMLIGAALFRLGLFSGGMDQSKVVRWGLIGVAAGALAHIALGLWVIAEGFPVAKNFFVMYGPAHVIRLPMIIGYAALLAAVAPRWAPTWLRERFSFAGRMAFTNYIAMSLVMAGIFQGWDLGLFDSFNRVELLGFVAFGAVLMLGLSKPWLAKFHYGPLEWLWRCLTYGKLFPIRRSATI